MDEIIGCSDAGSRRARNVCLIRHYNSCRLLFCRRTAHDCLGAGRVGKKTRLQDALATKHGDKKRRGHGCSDRTRWRQDTAAGPLATRTRRQDAVAAKRGRRGGSKTDDRTGWRQDTAIMDCTGLPCYEAHLLLEMETAYRSRKFRVLGVYGFVRVPAYVAY